MRYFASLCTLLLAVSPGFASAHHASPNFQNQFHFKPVGRRAVPQNAAAKKASESHLRGFNKLQAHEPKFNGSAAQARPASAHKPRHYTANPPMGKIGFVSATDVPVGGGAWNEALPGDFNNDGKTDVATVVGNYDTNSSTWVYSISVVLSNGDGTFSAPVLTSMPGNDSCAAVVVGDLNNDKKSDLIVAHQPNCNGNGYTQPTFDVLMGNGDGTFTVNTNNTNNTIATSGLAGGTLYDVNGDGKLDIITVDQGSPANVWTLLGNGDGTFAAPTSVALSNQVGGNVAFADLNGDGFVDIVDTDYSSNQVIVYLATSATAFGPASLPYTTPDGNYNACSLTVGDLNGDGKPEIVTPNCSGSGNDITVYVNNGDGTFVTGVYYDGADSGGSNSGPTTLYSEAVSIADVNGDGKADIISSNDYSGDVTILLGKGDGSFTVPTIGYATGGYPWTPAIVGDFNGDGLADILVPDDEFSLSYLKGYGDGSFRAALDYYAATSNYAYALGLASGDFNGDGQPDFVIGNECGGCSSPLGITVFLSRPDGSLQPGVNYGNSQYMDFVAVADFNGDGKLDIAATDYSTGVVQLFDGDGTGNFTVGPSFAADLASNPGTYGISVGDFNKDGHPDLAVVNYYGYDVAILLNDGTGSFLAPVPLPLNNQAWQGLAVGDINGDGNLDLVVPAYYGSSVAIFLGNGDGTFQAEQDLALGANDPGTVTLADLNGDGKLDMLVTLYQGGGQDLAIAMGNGDGTFGTFALMPTSLQDSNISSPYPQYLQVVDIDGDGNLDLVYDNAEYGTVGVIFGQGSGSFFDPVEYPAGGYGWALAVADVNGDGFPDVVVANDDSAAVSVLLNNNGAGTQPNFAVSPDQTSATISAGGSATFNLTITPSNLFEGTISFACGTLPSKSTCTFQPATLTPAGNGQWTTQLTIATTAATQALVQRSHGSMLLATFSGIGLFGLVFAGSFKKNRMAMVVTLMMLVLMLSLVGCGGGSSNNNHNNGGGTPGTPAGTYTVPVTATGTMNGATVSHSFNITLTVQ